MLHAVACGLITYGGKNGGRYPVPKLTARKVETLRQPGMYGDGAGLYLNVSAGGTKSWILRATIKGRLNANGKPHRVEVGLGSLSLVSLAEAREAAMPLRKLARGGVNPLDEKRRETLTFEQAAERVHRNLKPTWRSEGHADRWLSAIKRHANPHFGNRPIDSITSADILRALEPIWTTRHDTARRVMQRLSTIFDWAKGAGHYTGENPVTAIRKALPTVRPNVEHMAALPWQEVPGFMRELAQRQGVSARALEFLIHTAARSGEVRGSRWAEIDLEAKVWTVPAERMKTGKEHRVPLTDEAIDSLEAVMGIDEDLVFPSPKRGRLGEARPQSDTVFKALMTRMKRSGYTTHGFRSTFRDWSSESAYVAREVAEAALAHSVGSRVERAYARSDLFDRRRELMERWSRYCSAKPAQVVAMVRA